MCERQELVIKLREVKKLVNLKGVEYLLSAIKEQGLDIVFYKVEKKEYLIRTKCGWEITTVLDGEEILFSIIKNF